MNESPAAQGARQPVCEIRSSGLAELIRPLLPPSPGIRVTCRVAFKAGGGCKGVPTLVLCWGGVLEVMASWHGEAGFGIYDLAAPLLFLREGLFALARGAPTWFCPVTRPLAEAFRSLPERQRQVLSLHQSGERVKAIGVHLGLKPQTVSEHLRRARHHLKCFDPAG